MKKTALFLILCAALVPLAWGYEFQAEQVSWEGEELPAEKRKMDWNDQLYAVVSIETDVPDLLMDVSSMGHGGIEQTEKGYEIFLPCYGRGWVRLRAPGFKSYKWDFSTALQPGKYYSGRVARIGTEPSVSSISTLDIEGAFGEETVDLIPRLNDTDKRPWLKINTDLPFAFLEEHLLRKGAYEVQERNVPPYELRVQEGTPLQNVVRKDLVRGNIAWTHPLTGYKTAYFLDLTWRDKKQEQDVVQHLQKTIQESKQNK